ncbi:E3 SUMO-protein ligase ZBED1-like isoform X1 [Megachile rotundata]|uniref:E3 SUMO-protein ligase ZBED1-like isoform X1 n=2 Tax=Megachile rotundata TaxID=143995 RepID=UPI003FD11BB7
MASRKSLVWMYSIPSEDGKFVKCILCDSMLSYNRSTSAIMKHLRGKHRDTFSNAAIEVFDFDANESATEQSQGSNEACPRKKLQKMNTCTPKRQEEISQALARMISLNMMPISFCDSIGFQEFMAVLEPGYRCPCQKTIIKRLQCLYNEKRTKIEKELSMASYIAIASDGWSSRSQDSYISTTANFIDEKWVLKNYMLCTQLVEDRYTEENLFIMFNMINEEWPISGKVNSVVHDKTSNIGVTTKLLDGVRYNISCAAHILQLCVKDAFNSVDRYQEVIQKASQIVQYFHHSNVVTSYLIKKQKQLNLSEQKLVQNCPTKWSSSYYMCEQLVSNRNAIVAVLTDRTITNLKTALKLELSDHHWSIMNDIITVLKPLQIASTTLCSENSVTISLVLPIVHGLINNHLKNNDSDITETKHFKNILKASLVNRFNLDSRFETVHRIASFLDPRSKELSFESKEVRNVIKISVHDMMENILVSETTENTNPFPSALDFLYQAVNPSNDGNSEFEMYLEETQINHNLCPLMWWKIHEYKYPRLAKLAKMYLGIPAMSASSEYVLSTTGNISYKRNCLLPENVDLLVFLYKNKDI